jgi:membrane protease subunit HflK
MAWNEPGGNGKDPWGHRKKEQGPPDIEEFIQKLQAKLSNWLGRNNSGNSNESSGDGANGSFLSLLVFVALVVWLLFGFYIIQPAEQGVVTRFGRYQSTTEQGLNWHWPYPIESVQKVNVEQVRAINHKALMLTEDENIVDIELVVQYRVTDAKGYLFNVRDPDNTLHQATESALREVVGGSKMDAVLTSERTRVAIATQTLIQNIVDRYNTGLTVSSVNMQNAQPPEAVQAAFADVIKAREDEERSKNKAYAYTNEIVEKARGIADKLLEEARAYKAQVIAHAEGETQRFASVLQQYNQAPEITRQRLYLESIEAVLSSSSKIVFDVPGSNPFMVLPLEQLLTQANMSPVDTSLTTTSLPSMNLPNTPESQPSDEREDTRRRGER